MLVSFTILCLVNLQSSFNIEAGLGKFRLAGIESIYIRIIHVIVRTTVVVAFIGQRKTLSYLKKAKLCYFYAT